MQKRLADLIMEYFKEHPNKNLPHAPVVDYVEKEFFKIYGRKPRDPWRQIRRLHQEGFLIKVRKGIYSYDPDQVVKVELFKFPWEIKKEIFKRDGYRCVLCGRGRKEGITICADHIRPLDKNGTNSVKNGQTLCMEHNIMKKNYSQMDAGKKFFVRMYEQAKALDDKKMINFCRCIFYCYDQYKISTHIRRPDK